MKISYAFISSNQVTNTTVSCPVFYLCLIVSRMMWRLQNITISTIFAIWVSLKWWRINYYQKDVKDFPIWFHLKIREDFQNNVLQMTCRVSLCVNLVKMGQLGFFLAHTLTYIKSAHTKFSKSKLCIDY